MDMFLDKLWVRKCILKEQNGLERKFIFIVATAGGIPFLLQQLNYCVHPGKPGHKNIFMVNKIIFHSKCKADEYCHKYV